MYKLMPVFPIGDIAEVKSNMYKMKNILSDFENPISTSGAGTEIPSIAALEKRQNVLLSEIKRLKDLLDSIRAVTRSVALVKKEPGLKIDMIKPDFKEQITNDVVLNVSPLSPMYSLLGLNKLWENLIDFRFNFHLHSSVVSLPDSAKAFQAKLESKKSNKTGTKLNVTIIWKEIEPDCGFIISPFKGSSLLGEVNFLRFLDLSTSPKLELVSPEDVPKMCSQMLRDEKLDACHVLNHSRTSKSINSSLETLGEELDKNEWLTGKLPCVVDLAAWSVIKRTKRRNLPTALGKWFEKAENYFNS